MKDFLYEPNDDHDEQNQCKRSWIYCESHCFISHRLKSGIVRRSFYKLKIIRVALLTWEHVYLCESQGLVEENTGLPGKFDINETAENDDLHGVEQTPELLHGTTK